MSLTAFESRMVVGRQSDAARAHSLTDATASRARRRSTGRTSLLQRQCRDGGWTRDEARQPACMGEAGEGMLCMGTRICTI